jgi:hypothetical protein
MGSGFDDWIYWHCFTITINYYTRLAPLLAGPRTSSLPFWRMTNKEFLLTPWTALIDACLTNESLESSRVVVSMSWNKAPILGLRADFYFCQSVAGLLMRGPFSDERTGLSFIIAAGPRQRSHSRVRVPWDSPPYFTVSDSRLPFSSPPTTRRVTVEVFDPASARDDSLESLHGSLYRLARIHGNSYRWFVVTKMC